MSGRPYLGHGQFPPPPQAFPGYPYPPAPAHAYPPHPGHPQVNRPGPGFVYPYHPGYFYPQAPRPPTEGVQVEDPVEEPVEVLPEGELVELPYRSYRWVPASLSQYSIPPGALRVGTDADGAEIYVGRAEHEGDMIPAKVIPSKNACYVAFGGEEVLKDQFEVLVPAMFSWQFSTNGVVPPGAVTSGNTADGEPLYIGRVTVDGHTTPGKIQASHGTCYYPFDGEEKCSTEYECLVLI